MPVPERRQHPRVHIEGLRARVGPGRLELAVVDFGSGGVQCEGSVRFDYAETSTIDVVSPDGTVLASLAARPIYCRRVSENPDSYRIGFAFVGVSNLDIQRSIQAIIRYQESAAS